MIVKLPEELVKGIKSSDTFALEGVLDFLDRKCIEQLKVNKEDFRYTQGYSAAIDYLRSLITKKQQGLGLRTVGKVI